MLSNISFLLISFCSDVSRQCLWWILKSLDKDFSLLFRIKLLYFKVNVFLCHITRNNSLFIFLFIFSEYYFPLFYCFLFVQSFDKRRTTMINLIPSSFCYSSFFVITPFLFLPFLFFVSAKCDTSQNDVHCFYFIFW